MAHETRKLAEYAVGLRFEDLPQAVVQRAKDCIADTVASIVSGAGLPWSRMIVAYAERAGVGSSRILAPGGITVPAPMAALANGALSHAFEQDNLTWPSTGVHPGATLLSSALAVAQERGIGGRELIAAFVAGAEVMIRIGRAADNTIESRGFHAPGTTGPFGAAIAVGRLLRFDPDRMSNALGIAGSLAGGLMEFARSGSGAMVKRLHLGRAAESGVLAAGLAEQGFTGPASVLEGKSGFLNVFAGQRDLDVLTAGLGSNYATLSIMLKRFACHITGHTPVQAVLDLMAQHRYAATDVVAIHIAGSHRMATVNNIPRPADLMMAQYSIPFCVALAHFRDPRDPRAFDDAALQDADIAALATRVTITGEGGDRRTLESTVTVTLKDGRKLERHADDFPGTPQSPLGPAELREKFLKLTADCDPHPTARLFERLVGIEHERELGWLQVAAAPSGRLRKAGTA